MAESDRTTYTPLIYEGFALARAADATPAMAAKWYRRYALARQIMGAEACDELVKELEAVVRSRGDCPYCPGRADHAGDAAVTPEEG